jgi:hypothetical protein
MAQYTCLVEVRNKLSHFSSFCPWYNPLGQLVQASIFRNVAEKRGDVVTLPT